jgi:hypothetical protein
VASGSKDPQSGGDWLFVCNRSVVIYCSVLRDAMTADSLDPYASDFSYMPLRPFANGNSHIVIEEAPIILADALEALWKRCPGTRHRVVTEQAQSVTITMHCLPETSIHAS